jgi:hypothetical protein
MEYPEINFDERRVYFLSFGDPETRTDLGVAVVEVTGLEALREFHVRPDMHDKDKGPWMAAAIREAWTNGCNPGGQVMLMQVTNDAPTWMQHLERNRLYSDDEINQIVRQSKQ